MDAVFQQASDSVSDAATRTLHAAVCGLPLAFPLSSALAALALLKVVSLPPLAIYSLLLFAPIAWHVVGPVLDMLIGEQPVLTKALEKPTATPWVALPVLYVVAHWGAACAAAVAAGQLWAASGQAALPTLAALVVSLGCSMACGFAAGHELTHSRNPLLRAISELQLAWGQMWAYSRSHPYHHLHVATPADHTTGRRGEWLYSYMPRYMFGAHAVAWREEVADAVRSKSGLPTWANRMTLWMGVQVAALGLSYALGGVAALGVHLGAAAVGITYLFALDYALHYGLERAVKPGGTYAPVTASNSFSSSFLLENATFLRVMMHADHHMVAAKPYQALGFSADDVAGRAKAPRLGPGIPIMAASLLVFIPPLWFKYADPLADAANAAHREEVRAASAPAAKTA